jgi:ribosomal-protein-alanine N-acetyltransferase
VALPPAGDDADHAGVEVATLAHAAMMAEIHRTAFPASEAWSRDVMLLQVELPGTFGLVHPAGGMILARVAADEAEILTLAVIPGQRRHGIGRALLRAATRRAEAMGAASMFLEVAVTNVAARALYATQGFAEAGIRRRYYADGTDALILRSTLQAGVIDS